MLDEQSQPTCEICHGPLVDGDHSICQALAEQNKDGGKKGELKTWELVEEFMEKEEEVVLDMLKEIDPEMHSKVALKLIEQGNESFLGTSAKEFKGLNQEVADALFDKESFWVLNNVLETMEGVSSEFADKLIEVNQGMVLAKNLKSFDVEHEEVVGKLTEAGQLEAVLAYLQSFEGINQRKTADQLKTSGDLVMRDLFYKYLANFDELDIKEEMIESGAKLDYKYIDKYDLSREDQREIALDVHFDYWRIADQMDKFDKLTREDQREVAMKWLERDAAWLSHVDGFDKLTREDQVEVAMKGFERGAFFVIESVGKFDKLTREDQMEIAMMGLERNLKWVVSYIDRFDKLTREDQREVAMKWLECDPYYVTSFIATYIYGFDKLIRKDKVEIADKIIQNGDWKVVMHYRENFELTIGELQDMVSKYKGYSGKIKETISSFVGR